MEYDRAARLRLGRAVRAARTAAGYRKRESFADRIGRSARQVQAMENGETGVGPDTWTATAEALGWSLDRVYELLEGRPQNPEEGEVARLHAAILALQPGPEKAALLATYDALFGVVASTRADEISVPRETGT